ncbi:MAG: hypothetical protein H6595_10510 [Flavobacteriales bacterium]|nr:hypothetical protein [Flavobacteriales bacterium]MCB9167894.1 hypothetical protein [Flavobacteriales bacterium]
MNRSILLLAACLFMGTRAPAQDRDHADCVVKAGSSWGKPCEKCEYYKEGYKRDFSGTYQIVLKNVCSETMEVKVAVQEDNGTWRTFPVRVLVPDEQLEAFACHGSGKYLYWVRRLNDTEIILPSDQEIITEYRGK